MKEIPQPILDLVVAWRQSSKIKTSKRYGIGETTVTYTEIVVLSLIATGLQGKQIADLMGRSKKTVEKHFQSLHRKFNTHSAVHLTHIAIKNDLVIAGEFV